MKELIDFMQFIMQISFSSIALFLRSTPNLNICLLTCGLYFSKDALYQYMERKAAFQTTLHTLTLDDLPYITICYEGLHHDIYHELRFNNSAISEDWLISYMVEIVISKEVSGSDTVLFWDEQR